jgi:hypothetical protein
LKAHFHQKALSASFEQTGEVILCQFAGSDHVHLSLHAGTETICNRKLELAWAYHPAMTAAVALKRKSLAEFVSQILIETHSVSQSHPNQEREESTVDCRLGKPRPGMIQSPLIYYFVDDRGT